MQSESQYEGALAVVAKWMADRDDLQVQYHDGKAVDADIFQGVIRIPRLACSGGLDADALWLLRQRIYHESGHILETRLSKDEYPSGALFQIFNAVEDRRMEMVMGNRYPGAQIAFRKSTHYYNHKIAQQQAEEGINAPLWEALVAMTFRSMGVPPTWRVSDEARTYIEVGYAKFCEWRGLKSAQDSLALAHELFELFKEEKEEQQENESQSGDEEADNDQLSDGEGEAGEDEAGEAEEAGNDDDEAGEGGEGNDEAGEGSEGDGEAGKGAEGSENDGESSGNGETSCEAESGNFEGVGIDSDTDAELEAELDAEADGMDLDADMDADIVQALDELDELDQAYLPKRDNDEHTMMQPEHGDSERYTQEHGQISSDVAVVMQALEQALRAQTRCRNRRFLERGRLDSRRLAHVAMGTSQAVFRRQDKGEALDVAVEIVVDESGSMGQQMKGATQIDMVRRVAIVVCEALSRLGIPFELTGTTTKNIAYVSWIPLASGFSRTNPMVYRHYKSFGQRWAVQAPALMQMCADNHNVDGEVIEWASRRLQARSEPRKVVLSLSDGVPQAGHGDVSDREMAKNLIHNCERAREEGVEVYGFGVGTTDPQQFYGDDNFVYMDTEKGMAKLGAEFARAFASILMQGKLKKSVSA